VTDPLNAFLYLEVVKNIEKMYSSHPVIWPNNSTCNSGVLWRIYCMPWTQQHWSSQ
jgi:hypothetical protein